MILLPLGFMLFLNTFFITYICERNIVYSPLIAYHIRIGNKININKLHICKLNFLLKMTGNLTAIFFYNNLNTQTNSIKTKCLIKTDFDFEEIEGRAWTSRLYT